MVFSDLLEPTCALTWWSIHSIFFVVIKQISTMRTPSVNYARIQLMLEDIMRVYRIETTILVHRFLKAQTKQKRRRVVEQARQYSVLTKVPEQLQRLHRLINVTDLDCIDNLRMDRNTFGKLCRILKDRGGLHIGKCLGIEEQVAMFIGVLSHHKKNRVVRFNFIRSGSTVSYYVNKV